jgi:TolB-like protein/Tfp pilus assembly protein PilF
MDDMRNSPKIADRLQQGLAGRYSIERELGRGGMATVFLARDLSHDRPVAIKVLHHDVAAGVVPERFLREIRVLATLQHPNILPLHHSGVIDGIPYYVMPFVAGESLRDRISRERQLPVSLSLRFATEAASALDYAHRQGVIHRDIKPENILLSDDHVIIADFGIARAAAQSADDRLTATSVAIGTLAYMSPEQATGETDLDGRSDVYSLGCVVFEMLTGRTPFTGASPAAVLASRFSKAPPRLSSIRSDVPRNVDDAIASALTLSPDDRPSAREFAAMLSGDVAPSYRHRRVTARRLIPLAVAALVAVVAGFLWWRVASNSPSSSAQSASVAVLPFETAKGDEYFAAGMTDELIAALSNIHGLRVAAKNPTIAAAQSGTDLATIARRLGVSNLLSGSVRRQGDSLRVTAQLTDASTGYVVRSFSVNRRAGDVFAVQDEIAHMITSGLAVNLGARSARPLVTRNTSSLEAHDLYLKGKFVLDRPTIAATTEAIGYFNKAIELDSLYPQPWAGLGEAHASFGVGNLAPRPPRPEFEQARIAVARALSLDSTLAEAHAVLGLVQMMYDFNWDASLASLRRARALDPGYDNSYLYQGFIFSWRGQYDSALAANREGLHMSPTSNRFRQDLGRILILARRFDSAETVLRGGVSHDSTNGRMRMLLGETLMARGRAADAVAELERAHRILPDATRVTAFLVGAYARAGRTREAQSLMDSLSTMSQRMFVPAMDLAIAWAGLHNADEAMTWLERAYDDRTLRPFMRDPVFDFLIGEPRYRGLFARMKLPLPGVVAATR